MVALQPGPLRGRGEPLGRALTALRGTRQHGSSSIVLVSGPAGIGKTALLAEICRRAATMKFRVASSKCDQIEQVWPGAPVIAMLRAGRDPLATAAEYEQVTRLVSEPLLLVDRIASLLENAAMAGPVLIVVDDLQWADRVSWFALRVLMSRLTGLPAAWVLASRDDDFGEDLTGYERIRAERVRLAPLAAVDLAAIAADYLGGAPDERTLRLLDTADGNPFLATQMIESLARSADPDHVPAELTAAITNRLRPLNDTSRDLVRLLAVAGRPVPTRDVLTLMGGPDGEQAVADATASGLIVRSGDSLAFRHDLVLETVYAAIPGDVARDLHRMLADYYLTLARDPLMAAPHARAAATPGDLASAKILTSAAEKLVTVSADDAGELAALAFRTVRPAQAEWLGLSLRCLSVLCQAQRPAEAIAAADLILARTDDCNVIGQVETEAARALWLSGRVSELISRTERVLAITGLDAPIAARLRAAHALAGTRLADGGAAANAAASALDYARETGDREGLALALQAAGEAARNEARHQDALRYFRELRSLTGMSCLAEEVMALQFLDRYDHAQALLDEVRADGRATTEAILPALNYAQVWQDFTLGRLDDADSGARALIELGQQLGNAVYTLDAVIVRVAVALLRGETDTATAQIARARELGAADDSLRRPGLAVMGGWLAATRGGLEQALGLLRPVIEGAGQSRSYWPLWPCWNGLFFEFASLADDQDFAAACVDIAATAAARNPGVASFEGIALNIRGRRDRDLNMIAQSAAVLARSPRPVLRGFGADSYGRVLLADGQRSAGLDQLDRAWDDYHQMGAWAFRAEVQRTMRDAGARRDKWSAATARAEAGWSSLTEAERRVATLIAAGRTNKSAAAELGVSVNTIGTHLRAVFAKLGIQSRVQLANELHKLD